MPTYEYKCRECGHQLEIVQSFTDEALTTCPSCRKKALRKVFAPVGIVLKGSGFYKTDSRSSNGKSSTKADKSEKSEKSDTSSSSSDTKAGSDTKSSSSDKTSSSDKAKAAKK